MIEKELNDITYFRFLERVSRRNPADVRLPAACQTPNDGENRRDEDDDRHRPKAAVKKCEKIKMNE